MLVVKCSVKAFVESLFIVVVLVTFGFSFLQYVFEVNGFQIPNSVSFLPTLRLPSQWLTTPLFLLLMVLMWRGMDAIKMVLDMADLITEIGRTRLEAKLRTQLTVLSQGKE